MLHHFSEDPSIERFVPHVPPTNPNHEPAVWAIDSEHAAAVLVPAGVPAGDGVAPRRRRAPSFEERFATTRRAFTRSSAAGSSSMRSTRLHRYDFADDLFAPWPEATGQWIAWETVIPIAVEPLGDLLDLHAAAGIELRVVPSLWPLRDVVVAGPWEFSIVRMHNAQPR